MKMIKTFKRKPIAQWVACALAVASVAGAAYAAPLAGTEIKNLATVSYEDENGNKYTAQSNEAVITVAEQYRATLAGDRTQSAAPGQTVYFPHVLSNTGNTTDTYDLTTDGGAAAIIYEDKNGNGQPDSGENSITEITVAAGEVVNLVVGYAVPNNLNDSSPNIDVILTVDSRNAAIVTDIGDNADNTTDNAADDVTNPNQANDTDPTSATNKDTIDITTGPVLVLNKEAVFDVANDKVTYTLTIKNTGSSDAKLVDIIDAVPLVDHDGDGTATEPLTNIQIIAINGLLAGNGDTVLATGLAVLTAVDESVVGSDLNGNGIVDNAVDAIKVTDAILPANTTVSVVYSADYDPTWRANASIDNTFVTHSDNNDDATRETTTSSNTTHNVIPQTYNVIAEDDGAATAVANPVGVNDGKDDDQAATNDIQLVDKMGAGDIAIFTHTITNTGNGDDIFNLSITNDPLTIGFPTGTVFTFWSVDQTVQLTDSDSDGIPDTGVLGQNATRQIVVKADLPAVASGTGRVANTGYIATLAATSSIDNTATNTTTLKLNEITAPAVDLAAVTYNNATATVTSNNAGQSGNASKQSSTGFNDQGAENSHNEGPVSLQNAIVGSTISFPMSIANESGASDSFLLSHDFLPTGWTVVFKDEAGSTITSTPFLPANGTFNYTAEVTISTDPAQALADTTLDTSRTNDADGFDADNNNDSNVLGIGAVLTANDTDRDYVIKFIATSSVDAVRTDSILQAIDVTNSPAISITPDGQNQIQPGGTIDYQHKLSNDGNVAEAIEIKTENSGSGSGWGSTTLIEKVINVGGDVELVQINTLLATDTVRVYSADGTTFDVVVTDTDGDAATTGSVEIPLKPGEYLKVINKVFAPADAAQGTENATTLTAQDTDNTLRNIATDTSTVILGQVRLDKTVARQTNCTDLNTIGTFAAIQSNKVEPGQCVVWQIVAKNEGDARVKNVVITDNIPIYTTSLAGSLQYCEGASCTPATVSDSAGNDNGEVSAGLVTFYIGGSSPVDANNPAPDAANGKGGTLLSGESATIRFTSKVDQ